MQKKKRREREENIKVERCGNGETGPICATTREREIICMCEKEKREETYH